MEKQRVDMFLMSHSRYFESYQLMEIRNLLMQAEDEKMTQIHLQSYKDPTTMLIVSLIAGTLGVDRFLIGQTGLGILKLVTIGGLGIWTVIDWFLIMGITKRRNFKRLIDGLRY